MALTDQPTSRRSFLALGVAGAAAASFGLPARAAQVATRRALSSSGQGLRALPW